MHLVQNAAVTQVLGPEVSRELELAEVVRVRLQTLEGHGLADAHERRGRGHGGVPPEISAHGIGVPHHGAADDLLDKIELGLGFVSRVHIS